MVKGVFGFIDDTCHTFGKCKDNDKQQIYCNSYYRIHGWKAMYLESVGGTIAWAKLAYVPPRHNTIFAELQAILYEQCTNGYKNLGDFRFQQCHVCTHPYMDNERNAASPDNRIEYMQDNK